MISNYWVIRDTLDIELRVEDRQSGEVLGIFVINNSPFLIDDGKLNILEILNEQIGSEEWMPYTITKSEFETYREFGFREYNVTCTSEE